MKRNRDSGEAKPTGAEVPQFYCALPRSEAERHGAEKRRRRAPMGIEDTACSFAKKNEKAVCRVAIMAVDYRISRASKQKSRNQKAAAK